MVLFEASTLLNAVPEKVFEFHENPENIRRIAPRSLKVLRVECGKKAVEGERFHLEISQFGITLRWTGIWEKVERESLLVDVSEKSPFAHWRHSHIFQPCGGGCRMTDRVECQLPGGWAGRMAGRLILPAFLSRMFQERHRATRRLFSGPTAG